MDKNIVPGYKPLLESICYSRGVTYKHCVIQIPDVVPGGFHEWFQYILAKYCRP